jgi:glutamyl-Q tRNA(Asp) synthetase
MSSAPHEAVTGRFAPSPTGPLHLGSLVAAVGSWLFARSAGGRFLVRMEDLDRPRVVPGAADDLLRALELYGLTWDGPVVRQSERGARYDEALARLGAGGHVFDCACSRAELSRSASAPDPEDPGDEGPVYPGTCRDGLPRGREARAVRFRVREGPVAFTDLVHGGVVEATSRRVGDFVVRRADGIHAYQLAVVVDDGAQGVTQVVRGADLLSSTGRQLLLREALGLPPVVHAHLPLVVGPDGLKLGKRHGALPLPTLRDSLVRRSLALALRVLGQAVTDGRPGEMLAGALSRFDPARVPRGPYRLDESFDTLNGEAG